jgi:acyl dehydratase
MTLRDRSAVTEGDELPPLQVPVTRADLVRYAGASGDFNPIHWNERFAREVGLPDVVECGARFTRPVVVPDDGTGALVELSGTVKEIRDDGTAVVAIVARSGGRTVLGKATATVALG